MEMTPEQKNLVWRIATDTGKKWARFLIMIGQEHIITNFLDDPDRDNALKQNQRFLKIYVQTHHPDIAKQYETWENAKYRVLL